MAVNLSKSTLKPIDQVNLRSFPFVIEHNQQAEKEQAQTYFSTENEASIQKR